ncbi:filamentous hemagglutinin N-terminal domain-containing protein [Parendozoicomonas sp. Alg238-R29]|uniref:two-partner secretion domain-containing protein n=1 Tax=Parendozoicomonas sp. Alg238-R29 TaxID=2993446 RepID=UPI00248EF0C0|nr:filamentous hemagglutinin N-terminal domain-containing protein [Parendozoicomonas sp. Alg238-R29]
MDVRSTLFSPFISKPLVSAIRRALASTMLVVPVALRAELAPDVLPEGSSVIRGDVSITSGAGAMDINQGSNRAIVEWQSFNIGEQASVIVNQPSTSSSLLNRVIGADPSKILGGLQANGQVILINPNGVLFGADARIDVGSIVTSTLQLSNDDFLQGNYQFTQGSTGAGIEQLGSITADSAAFIAASIVNKGQIKTEKSLVLATGETVRLSFDGHHLISVDVSAADWNARIHNSGIIDGGNGLVLLKADVATDFLTQVVSSSQSDIASQAIVDNGRVRLVSNSGRIAGRTLKMDSGDQGQTVISGSLDASSDTNDGGRIEVTGGSVLVEGTAYITADGKTGGGDVYIGGGWQGRDPDIRQSVHTTVEQGATISASATEDGDGGTLVVWSDIHNPDSVTTVNGTLKAEGKGAGSQGGQVETSGYQVKMGDQTRVSTLSPYGDNGQWLIDPQDYTIAASGGDITGATLSTNLASGNITILSSSGSTAGNGDIHVNDAVSWSANNLTLTADRDININAVMTASGTSSLTMTANNNSGDDGDPFDTSHTPAMVRNALRTIGRVRVSMHSNDSGFKGKVEFGSRTGTGFLTINGEGYTVINSLSGTAGVVDLDEGPNGGSDLAYNDASIRYALGTDITNAGSFTNSVIGDGDFANKFMGVLDGLGHTIDGLEVTSSANYKYHGLFSSMEDATVRNLGLTHYLFDYGGNRSYIYKGVLAGRSNGNNIVHNVYTTGLVAGYNLQSRSGGLVAYTSGSLTLDSVFTDVQIGAVGTSYHGGLLGYVNNSNLIMINSHASGDIDSISGVASIFPGSNLGGLIGYIGGTASHYYTILDSYSTSDINRHLQLGEVALNYSSNIGGLIGSVGPNIQLSIDHSYASGDAYGNKQLGGLIGVIDSSAHVDISNTYASGHVIGLLADVNKSAGSFIGEVGNGNNLNITDSFSYGKMIYQNSSRTGGFIGYLSSGSPVLNRVFYNSSDNSVAVGEGTATGLTGKSLSEFAGQPLANTLGTSDWIYDANYAFPILNNMPLLPQFLDSYAGNIVDVSITAGGAGTAAMMDGVSVFFDQSAIGIDTLNAALATGDVIIKTGGRTLVNEIGDLDINTDLNLTNNTLTLMGSHDVNVKSVVNVGTGATLKVAADEYTKDYSLYLNTDDTVSETVTNLKTHGRFRVPIAADDSSFSGRIDIADSGYGAIAVNGVLLDVIHDFSSLNTYASYALGSELGTLGTATNQTTGISFVGIFDGLGHSINSFNITASGTTAGLFSKVDDALIRNLNLNDLTVDGNTGNSWANVGGLAGQSKNTITHNLLLSGIVTNTGFQTGGLFGHKTGDFNLVDTVSSSLVINSTMNQSNSPAYAGGIYGNGGGQILIHNAHVSGDIRSFGHNVGGLAGHSGSAKISQSFSSGDVNADRNPRIGSFNSAGIGGLIGQANGRVAIENSFASGDVYGGTNIGGLIGRVSSTAPTILNNVYSGGDVESAVTGGPAYAGGLIGGLRYTSSTNKSDLQMSRAFAYGTITSQDSGVSTGGILGGVYNNSLAGSPPVTSDSIIDSQVTFGNTFWKDQFAPNGSDQLCVIGGGLCGTTAGTYSSDTSSLDGTQSQVRALTAAQFANPTAELEPGSGVNLANSDSTSLTSLLGDDFVFSDGQSAPGFKESLFSSETQFGPPPISLYIRTNSGTSVYGSAPSLGYLWIDADGNAFDLSGNGITVSGSIRYLNAPDALTNVGSYAYQYASGLTLNHATQNYLVLPWSTDGLWSITPKPLTISGTSVADKIYDRSLNADVTPGTLNGLLTGQTLGINGTGLFADKNAENNKNVTVSYTTVRLSINQFQTPLILE